MIEIKIAIRIASKFILGLRIVTKFIQGLNEHMTFMKKGIKEDLDIQIFHFLGWSIYC